MVKNKPAHVVTTTRKYKGKTYKTHLLRQSYRENGKVKKHTLANLTPLGDELVELIRRQLRGEKLLAVDEVFEEVRSWQQGQVKAVRTAMRKLGFAKLLGTKRSRQRDIVQAMVAAQILKPQSKLATTRWWKITTLPGELGVEDATEDELYETMDWLLKRQDHIEKKLAARHLEEGGMVLYDLSSSYFEGVTCPLAARGHNRDGKKGKLQVNYGLLTDDRGCPVSVSVYEGNTGDPKTLLPQVHKVRERFDIGSMVLVGDRGMISQKQVNALRDVEGVSWITALKSGAIRKLIVEGHLQLGLFDERNLFELEHPDYPGERLVACRNEELKKLREKKRRSLLDATAKELEKVRGMAGRGKLKTASAIGVRVGKVVNKYKVAKHFVLDIRDGRFDYHVDKQKVADEALLDGIYVVRTCLPRDRLNAEDTVRSSKRLSQVERAFRSMKTVDLYIRPIRHHLEDRVRAHIFLCTLAYYVTWHMLEAWRPILFADEEIDSKKHRDPVAPARRSKSARRKAQSRRLDDGSEVHSFQTMLASLSNLVKNVCRRRGANDSEATTVIYTTPDAKQREAFRLLESIKV
jgi:transposase